MFTNSLLVNLVVLMNLYVNIHFLLIPVVLSSNFRDNGSKNRLSDSSGDPDHYLDP